LPFINSNVDVVRSVANYAAVSLLHIVATRNKPSLGRNAIFCMDRYNCALDDILYGTKIEDVVHFFVSNIYIYIYIVRI